MHARSAEALTAAREAWEPVLRGAQGRAGELASEIYQVVDTVDRSASLRRALTDPNRSGEDRAALAQHLLGGRLDGEVVDLVAGMVRREWSEESDLSDALVELGDFTLLVSAQQAERLERVESELHGVVRLLDSDRELRTTALDRTLNAERRADLMADVLGGTVAYETTELVRRVIVRPRTPNPVGELQGVIEAAAAQRNHLVASVRSATPLNDEQIGRLADALERRYGRPVDVQVGIDPELLGGLRVRVGDDLIDDTISRRLDDVRRRLSA